MTWTVLWQALLGFILFLTSLALWRILEADEARQHAMDDEYAQTMRDYEQRQRLIGRD